MGWKDAEPDAYNRRIFRFCAGWLERVMQAIAEAAWLLQSNRWPFGPRYFSTKSFDPRDGGLSIVGEGSRSSGSTPNGFARTMHSENDCTRRYWSFSYTRCGRVAMLEPARTSSRKRIPVLAAELVRRKVAVIAATGGARGYSRVPGGSA
jgi:hypothetical protein